VLLRAANRVFGTRLARRLLSTPRAEHQTDPDGYRRRGLADGVAFLGEFGADGNVAGRRVLDLGCGLGVRTAAVARAGAIEAIGIDLDPGKISTARGLSGRSGVDAEVAFVAGGGSALPFAADRFDVVLLLDVVEHLSDPAAVLGECARVLGPGGRVLVGFPPYRSPWGGHLFTHVPVPWVHLLFPDREVLEVWRERHREAVERRAVVCSPQRERAIMEAQSTASLWDCNGMTIGGFLELVGRTPLQVRRVRFKVLGNLGGWMARSEGIREYVVTRVSAVLEA
jgi:SAM-dependent methyltransferase